MMDFTELYYDSVECIRCNLCLDKCPVVRAVGIDKAPLYSSVYTAMGSRFDLNTTTEDAYQCIDCYECDVVCPVDVPIADTMLYVRQMAVQEDNVPKGAAAVADKAANKENVLGDRISLESGQADVALFLGYAGEVDQDVVDAFGKICKAADVKYTVITDAADSGYLLARLGYTDKAKIAVEENAKLFKDAAAKVVVTPCSFSYEAFTKMYPEGMEYKHISEFIAELIEDGKLTLKQDDIKVGYHDAHFLTRVNGVSEEPRSIINAISGQAAIEPSRTGHKTAASGMGGGLGLFQKETMDQVSDNRAIELANLDCDTVVSGCVFEKYALKDALTKKDVKIIDITQYVAQAI